MIETKPDIDITEKHWEILKSLIKLHIPGMKVWLYGSRVKGTARRTSDLDMVVFAEKEDRSKVSNLREAFEESNLPYPVSVLIWNQIPEDFHEQVMLNYVELA